MGVAIQQTVSRDTNTTNPATTITATTAGDLIVVVAAIGFSGQTITSVTDNATGGANSYVSAGATATDTGAGNATDVFYSTTTRGGVTTVTATLSNTGSTQVYVLRATAPSTGVALDVVNHANTQTTSTTPSGASVTTNFVDVVISAIIGNSGAGTVRSGGFTNDGIGLLSGGVNIASLTQVGAGLAQCAWNWSPSSPTCSSTVSFKGTGSVVVQSTQTTPYIGLWSKDGVLYTGAFDAGIPIQFGLFDDGYVAQFDGTTVGATATGVHSVAAGLFDRDTTLIGMYGAN